jgi:predicted transcriptional regulator
MLIELKPEQQRILERAVASGMTRDEVIEHAFALIDEQHQSLDWLLEDREAIAAHIAQGVAQAERGELVDEEEAVRILRQRRAGRQVA